MHGNEQVIEQLNEALKAELTAIAPCLVHEEMCGNWGYADVVPAPRIGSTVKTQVENDQAREL